MKICAVIVAYQPDVPALAALARTLAPATEAGIVVIDNTPPPRSAWQKLLDPAVEVVALGENTGIAHAQNVGIRRALARGADAVAFFDQDSTIDAALLPTLAAALDSGTPCVVGPRCVDAVQGFEYPAYRLSRWGYPRKVHTAGRARPFPVDLLISSGSIATTATFGTVGLMDEALFIDFVDLEWCLRCRARGVPLAVVPAVTMVHSIGSRSANIGPLKTFVHSPARNYYKLRNAFLMWRRPHVPRLYAGKVIVAALVHSVLQLSMATDRGARLRANWAGLCDGLRGIDGRMPAR